MRRHRGSALAACVLLLLAGCANPPQPAARQDTVAPTNATLLTTQAALGVFQRVCTMGIGDMARMEAQLRSLGFNPVPPAMGMPFLRGNPGTAWMRADPASVALPVAAVLRPQGRGREVTAGQAEPELAATRFRAMIEAIAGDPLVVRKENDEARAPDGGPGHFIMYRAGIPPLDRGGFLLAMSVRPPAPGRIALLMTANFAQ